MKALPGIVRGSTIELAEPPGIPEGQHVLVQMTEICEPGLPKQAGQWPYGGSMSADWTEEDDQILESIHQERKAAVDRGPSE